MKPNISAYQSAIRAVVAENGWEVSSIEDLDAWWCHEAWRLRSTWAPRTCHAYLTFLIDPQSGTDRLQRGDYRVWAVLVSASRPTAWQGSESDFTLPFSGTWQNGLSSLVEHLRVLRDAHRV
jgi:hypothetical protein